MTIQTPAFVAALPVARRTRTVPPSLSSTQQSRIIPRAALAAPPPRPKRPSRPSIPPSPRPRARRPHGATALADNAWFKLICGASSHDAPTIANLAHVYALAGADCVDVAAEPSIVSAAQHGIARAVLSGARAPLLMVSLSDGPDVHFRKAAFDATRCPPDCARPCEAVCPVDAIVGGGGVVADRCYGCGRCVPACPLGLVDAFDAPTPRRHRDAALDAASAVEVHTAANRLAAFHALWEDALAARVASRGLRLVAVSLPDLGEHLAHSLSAMHAVMRPALRAGQATLVWQTDGRPMCGDVAPTTAHAAVRLATRVQACLRERAIPGHVQLAGGTNDRTAPLMRAAGLRAGGVAMGGYARKIVREALGADGGHGEPMTPESLRRALDVAVPLVQAVKEHARVQT